MTALRLPFALALAALALVVPAAASAAPGDVRVQVESRDTTLLDGGGGATARASAQRSRHPVHVVVLRRPALGRVPRLDLHRLHQPGRQRQARRVQPRDRAEAAADAVPRARVRRPQQPEPRLLQEEALRVRVGALGLRLPARPQPADAVPRLEAELRRRHRLGPARGRSRSARAAGSATRIRTRSSRTAGSTCSCAGPAGTRTTRPRRTGSTGRRPRRSCSARPPRAATSGRTRSTSRRPTARS